MHSLFIAAVLLLDIKALSPADVQALQEGQGMGLARAAELNHYPGPRHVLDLAEKLHLSGEQRVAVQAAHDKMKAASTALGRDIVELEQKLDEAFASATIDEKRLAELTSAIAERQGRLRYVHLAAHLAARAALTPEQVRTYDAARGYVTGAQQHHGH